MSELPAIPFADIRGGTSLDLLKLFPERARSLAKAAANTFGPVSRAANAALMPLGDRASRQWLRRSDNPYCAEIDALAAHLGIRGVHFLNVCFEWAAPAASGRTATGRRCAGCWTGRFPISAPIWWWPTNRAAPANSST